MEWNQPNITKALQNIVGAAFVFADHDTCIAFSTDCTEELSFKPDVVIKPGTAQEISEVMKFCNEHKIPVTPRGAGTGLTGGALPVCGGVLLSTERLNNIVKIDEDNLQVVTEPAVITEVLQDAVKEKGLYYPPDPASKGSCFIGGNVAENSGGPKAVKYGVVKDYVLNLEVVLPTGEIIQTGANVLKNATGYNLTQLLVGSEGTLGIITKITLRLIPYPRFDLLMLAPFYTLENAGRAVAEIFKAGITPSVIELIEKDALEIVCKMLNHSLFSGLQKEAAAVLLIEVDGNNKEVLYEEMDVMAALLAKMDTGDILFAEDEAQKSGLWQLRRRVAEAVKLAGYTIEEDTVVPRAALPQLIKGVKALGVQHGFKVVCYGHAGDGNLHIRINKEEQKNSYGNSEMQAVLHQLFLLVKSLGGTISAEHGIGLIQKSFMPVVFEDKAIDLMRQIKAVFDPNNILNPQKIIL